MLAMSMIHGLQLINIGCHTDTKLTFGKLTAIVGQNGTGKTTVLKAVEQAEKLARTNTGGKISGLWTRESIDTFFDSSIIIPTFQASPSQDEKKQNVSEVNFCFGISVNSTEDKESAGYVTKYDLFGWAVKFGKDKTIWQPELSSMQWSKWKRLDVSNSLYYVADEESAWDNINWPGDEGPYRIQGYSNILRDSIWKRIHVGTCRYLKVAVHTLREASYTDDIEPKLAPDASNLSSVLADLMTSNRKKFVEILTALQGVVPSILDIRATRCPVTLQEASTVTVNRKEIPYFEDRVVPGFQLRFDTSTGKNLPATSISDGTLYTLALTTLIATSGLETLILIDDVESGLHPSAQRALVRQIKALQEQNKGLQIIMTTHSPYVIDELEANQVWLLHQNSDEGVAAKMLSEHPRAKEALEVLTTGEFWTSEGEAWVSDEKATAAAV